MRSNQPRIFESGLHPHQSLANQVPRLELTADQLATLIMVQALLLGGEMPLYPLWYSGRKSTWINLADSHEYFERRFGLRFCSALHSTSI